MDFNLKTRTAQQLSAAYPLQSLSVPAVLDIGFKDYK
jgi:hypothetical protein